MPQYKLAYNDTINQLIIVNDILVSTNLYIYKIKKIRDMYIHIKLKNIRFLLWPPFQKLTQTPTSIHLYIYIYIVVPYVLFFLQFLDEILVSTNLKWSENFKSLVYNREIVLSCMKHMSFLKFEFRSWPMPLAVCSRNCRKKSDMWHNIYIYIYIRLW